MKDIKRILTGLLLCAMLFVASCSSDDEYIDEGAAGETENPTIPEDTGDEADDDLVPNTQTVSYTNAITIAFSGTEVNIDNPYEGNGVDITNNGSHVVITATDDTEYNYILSGVTSDGSVKIYGSKKFGLILNGVGITNLTGAAINIQNKKKATAVIVDNTNNRLIDTDSESYVYTSGEDMKATFFSEGNLDISGNGKLEIRGKCKHALCTDGSLSISAGNIHIKEAASDGIHTNDEIEISGGTLTIRSDGDGIESESKSKSIDITGGTIAITTTGEKGHAIKTKYNVNINTSSSIEITVYGNASKGIKPTGDLTITKGNITINTAGDAIWEDDEQDTSSAAGIKCDGDLLIENGTITILSTGKGGKGINVDGTLTINNGTITVTTTGDQYVYDRNNDTAAKAIKSTGDLTVNGGTIVIRTSKTEAEGLESKATLTINGGDLDIVAYDDCINASNHIQINGGNIYCYSTTNDGIDSNGTLTITDGVIVSIGAESPEEGFDCDQNRFTITGGIAIGVGGSTSTPTSSYCKQRSVVYKTSTSSSPSIIHIASTSDEKEVLTFKLPRSYSKGMTLLFTSPNLAASTGYTIYTGGSISGGSDFHGYYTGATYTKGSQAATFTTNNMVTTVGTTNNRPN